MTAELADYWDWDAPAPAPVVRHAEVVDLGEENRKSWVKKRLLLGI